MPKVTKKARSERPTREKKLGLFMTPSDGASGAGFLMPTPLNVGAGEPGPGDEWHLPVEESKQNPSEPTPRVLEERPQAQRNVGLFMSPDMGSGAGGFLVPMEPLNVGPGEPGPEDEWQLAEKPAKS
jgi:hypothetical protein